MRRSRAALVPARLSPLDLMRLSSVGLRTRPLRAALSALGIAIGVASIVAVLGLSSSSQAGLLAEIDRLGTNLLAVSPGQTITGGTAKLPPSAPRTIARIGPVEQVESTAETTADAFRTPLIRKGETNGLTVEAASLGLPRAVGARIVSGRFLNAATEREPVVVLGAAAARRIGIGRVYPGERIWVGETWFYLAGVLSPAALVPEIDSAVLVGYPAAERYLGLDPRPSRIYVRTDVEQVEAVAAVLGATADPEDPGGIEVSRPSSALSARVAAQGAFAGLFLGLGAVALLVGAVGVANIMIISVLERRSEIGLRRALGATRGQIRVQFLVEAIMLGLFGGAAGVAIGALATVVYANAKSWAVVIPTEAWAGGVAAAILIGAVAGLAPAIRAARLSPTEALRTP